MALECGRRAFVDFQVTPPLGSSISLREANLVHNKVEIEETSDTDDSRRLKTLWIRNARLSRQLTGGDSWGR